MKFRKKPIIIEAEQWFPGIEIQGVFEERVIAPNEQGIFQQAAYIETLEGKMLVTKGDWIITGIAGERYPCKPDIFERTYEKVE